MEHNERDKLIQYYLSELGRLQAEDLADHGIEPWPPRGFYWLFHIVVGMILGMIGAGASLMVNVVGAALVGRESLDLIRVYLTFPMGADALDPATTGGKVLFVGCVLYLVTGGIFGIMYHLMMRWYFHAAPLRKRFIVTTIAGVALWIVNFYLILSWLQPALLGGNWILTELPFWVAAGTHLVFVWTMFLVEGWGQFEPYSDAGPTSATPPITTTATPEQAGEGPSA